MSIIAFALRMTLVRICGHGALGAVHSGWTPMTRAASGFAGRWLLKCSS